MPLVSQMLLHARGTRGAPRAMRGPGLLREASTPALDATLRRLFAQISVARPELGLPFRRSEFADVLLDQRADFRADFPPISPQGAVALLCEIALLDRRRDQRMRGLDTHLVRIGQRVHLAMTRHLCAHREHASGPVLVEPGIDPGRWVPGDLRLGPLALLLCDALRCLLLLDLERRLHDPIEVHVTKQPALVVVDVLGCVRYRHEIARRQVRAQCLLKSGRYIEQAGATYRPLAPLGTWHWLGGFLNRHRGVVDAVARTATDEPEVAAAWAPRFKAWLLDMLRAALRRSGAMSGLRRAIRASLPYTREQLELACRVRRDPNAQLLGYDLVELLQREPVYQDLRRESRTLLHLCAMVGNAELPGRPIDPQRLKARLHQMGLSPAGWRLLCRHGTPAYAAQLKGKDSHYDVAVAAVATLNLVAACQRPCLPPVELMRQLGEIEDQNTSGEPLVPMPLLRAAWDHALALPTRHARRAFAADAFARAVTWWRRGCEHPGIPAGSPWAWFEERTRAWEARKRAMCAADGSAWIAPIGEFLHEGVRAIALETLVALWDEGLAMRHCVGSQGHVNACATGTERVYSLRDARSGRRLATTAFVRKAGGAWLQGQLSGFANRPVTRADVLAASAELLRLLNLARVGERAHETSRGGDAIGTA